jgi:hypothetical protein
MYDPPLHMLGESGGKALYDSLSQILAKSRRPYIMPANTRLVNIRFFLAPLNGAILAGTL